MKRIIALTALVLLSALSASPVMAQGPYTTGVAGDVFSGTVNGTPTPNMSDFPNVVNALNLLLGTAYTSNKDVDYLQVTGPTSSFVTNGASGFAAVSVSAGNPNSFEIYDTSNPGTKVDIFGTSLSGNGFFGDGSFANPFPAAGHPFAAGTSFGLSLNTHGMTANWDSNAALNPDGIDHMFVYHLTPIVGKKIWVNTVEGLEEVTLQDPYYITWEDLWLGSNGAYSDQDYNDLGILFDNGREIPPPPGGSPVPEPMTVTLLAGGLSGLAFLRRKSAL